MKPQPNDLANVLLRSVESATQRGRSVIARRCREGRPLFGRYLGLGGAAARDHRGLTLRPQPPRKYKYFYSPSLQVLRLAHVSDTVSPYSIVANQNKIGRNERCRCGSGKKYKHCHGSVGAQAQPL